MGKINEKEIRKERRRLEIEIEVIKMAHKYSNGQCFLVSTGDSDRFWKLVKNFLLEYNRICAE